MKQVRFTNVDEIHEMITWNFAYREARKSNWPSVVADRFRFKRRCDEVEKSISYIFVKNSNQN